MWGLVLAGTLVTVWFVGGYLAQRGIIYPRLFIFESLRQFRPVDAEVLRLRTAVGPVEAWFLPGEGVSEQAPGPAVLFAHGNGDLIDFVAAQFEPYTELGVDLGYRRHP